MTVPTDPGIKTGDFVEIPKGATYYHRYGYGDKAGPQTLTRKTVAKAEVHPVQTHWKDGKEVRYTGTGVTSVLVGWRVYWADKYTDLNNVTKVEPPAEKEAKGPTLRQRMVKDTKWKVTAAFPHYVKDAGVHRVSDRNPNYTWTEFSIEQSGVVPEGAEFVVLENPETSYPGIDSWRRDDKSKPQPVSADGLWVRVKFTAGERDGVSIVDKWAALRLTEMGTTIEQIGEADPIPVFYIFDKATEQYYGGYDSGTWNSLTHERTPGFIAYSTKLSKAKKFNRLADVRAHSLVMSGYYYDLPESWGSIPDWMDQGKSFDIPDTWEIHKIDKLSKKVMDRIELVDTFNRSWRLRAITVKYGGAVRAIYSDLEKKNKLDQFSAVMLFGKVKDDADYWSNELNDSERADVKACVSLMDKSDVKFGSGLFSQAVGVKDVDTAVMAKLSYTGKLKCQVIDLVTLTEVVENQ